jgi:hypothetical protein
MQAGVMALIDPSGMSCHKPKELDLKKLLSVALLLALFQITATRAELIYDNGPLNGSQGAVGIFSDLKATVSFTVDSDWTLTSATVGLWTISGDPSTVGWSIGSSAFGTDVASGNSSMTNTPVGAYGSYSLLSSSLAIDGVVGPGTYWLTLTGAAGGTSQTYWDINNGPSMAYHRTIGDAQVNSFAFQIRGTAIVATVPEPSTWAMLGVGAVGVAMMRRRRRAVA